MKAALAYFLFILLAFTQLHNAVVWANYEMNKAEITELFCVNKDKPELNCHGSCHLSKMLSSHYQENKDYINGLFIPQLELMFQEKASFCFLCFFQELSLPTLGQIGAASTGFYFNITQPPEA